ncbi:TonB-dependent receptor domain-containing protein [Roseospirillum parvum]|uniref:Hemoglobin/transferrin/lactoferrin receptor protein n=1 Tax=Roseospirillum parvum TaxID=83401 RepID=A0A1G8AMD4_9PROT|nr:TonB-dependent receptor [Roseospirillum parvum]SDH22094.1 hemoglobin/transferrin/lactoferrin receptor protein [Roseospirillum parvum]
MLTPCLRRHLTATGLIAPLLAPLPSLAEEAADTAQPTTNLELGRISVTATRNAIDPFLYPGMVSVLGREEIDDLNPSSPDDVLKMIPGVAFEGGPRRTGEVPSIRGFDGADVVILIDGARQNFGSGHDGRFYLDPSLLRSAEVLRGSASALYGSGGTGGVIEFRSVEADDYLAPDEHFGTTLSVGYQSVAEEWAFTSTAYARPSDEVDLLASLTRRTSGPIDLGDGTTLEDADDEILSALVKGGLKIGNHEMKLAYSRFRNEAKEPNNGQLTGGTDIVDKTLANDNVTLAWAYDPDSQWIDLDATFYYNQQGADEVRLDAGGAGPTGELLRRDLQTAGLRIDNRSRFSLGEDALATLTYGIEGWEDRQDGAAGSTERGGVPDAEALFAGIYAQLELTLTEPLGLPGDLMLLPGVRYDSYHTESSLADEVDETHLSPRLGASYLPTEWLMVFTSYGEAFRAPTLDEVYAAGTHFTIPGFGTNSFVPNPDLKPQTTTTLEYGLGVEFEDVALDQDRLAMKASQFRIKGEDFIDQTVNQPAPPACFPPACNGTTEQFNVPNAALWGTEVEASYEFDRVRLALGYSSINGKNTDTGERLGVLQPDRTSLELSVKLPEIDSRIGWRGIVASNFKNVNDPTDRREAYDVHDVYLVYTPTDWGLDGLRVDLGVDNAFDENYARTAVGAAETGRNYKTRLSYTLNW